MSTGDHDSARRSSGMRRGCSAQQAAAKNAGAAADLSPMGDTEGSELDRTGRVAVALVRLALVCRVASEEVATLDAPSARLLVSAVGEFVAEDVARLLELLDG